MIGNELFTVVLDREVEDYGLPAAYVMARIRFLLNGKTSKVIGPSAFKGLVGKKVLTTARDILVKAGAVDVVKAGKMFSYSINVPARKEPKSDPNAPMEQKDVPARKEPVPARKEPVPARKEPKSDPNAPPILKEEDKKKTTTNALAARSLNGWDLFAATIGDEQQQEHVPEVVNLPENVYEEPRRRTLEIDLEDATARRGVAKQRRAASGARSRKLDARDLDSKIEDLVAVYPSPHTDRGAAARALQDSLAIHSFDKILAAARDHAGAREAQYLTGLHKWIQGSMFLNPVARAAAPSSKPGDIRHLMPVAAGTGPIVHTRIHV